MLLTEILPIALPVMISSPRINVAIAGSYRLSARHCRSNCPAADVNLDFLGSLTFDLPQLCL